MSEGITHVAVCDDCLRLFVKLPETCDAFRLAIVGHRDVAQLGSITRSTDRFNPQLLTRVRSGWESRKPAENLEAKLAYSLGALCHRAADRTFKPVFKEVAPDDPQDPKDVSVYHDVYLFREVYREGAEPPYPPTMFDSETGFEEHFRVLVQRALLAMHTFIPDLTDPEGWLDRLLKLRQAFYVEISRYADAYYHPDPDKVLRYIKDINFYDSCDPLVEAAREIQIGREISETQVAEIIATGKSDNKYGQALRRGLGYLAGANGYFIGELDEEGLAAALQIGRPELAG